MDMFYSLSYLIVMSFRVIYEKVHTITHCSTKLHTPTMINYSLECFMKDLCGKDVY